MSKAVAEVLAGERQAFDVPARPHGAPLGLEAEPFLHLLERGAPEQGEVTRVVLLVALEIDGGPEADLAEILARELPVGGHAADVEVDVLELLVGGALAHQLAGERDHVLHRLRGPGVRLRRGHPEGGHVLEELRLVAGARARRARCPPPPPRRWCCHRDR
jgi:hypothetical protein